MVAEEVARPSRPASILSKDYEPEDRDDLDDDDDPVDDLPPVRTYTPGHRQPKPKPVINAGPSPWERPRDGFTASMTERVPEMRSTKQAGYVKGTTREA